MIEIEPSLIGKIQEMFIQPALDDSVNLQEDSSILNQLCSMINELGNSFLDAPMPPEQKLGLFDYAVNSLVPLLVIGIHQRMKDNPHDVIAMTEEITEAFQEKRKKEILGAIWDEMDFEDAPHFTQQFFTEKGMEDAMVNFILELDTIVYGGTLQSVKKIFKIWSDASSEPMELPPLDDFVQFVANDVNLQLPSKLRSEYVDPYPNTDIETLGRMYVIQKFGGIVDRD